MSMDQYYEQWHKQVDDLHFRLQDCFDEPNHQNCQQLVIELRDLINDLSQSKSPRDIEVRVIGIIDLIEPARNGSATFLTVSDAVKYHDIFERLRRDIHSHPHYN